MSLVTLRKHRKMILISVFFFYLGCGLTLSFLKMDCVDASIGDPSQDKTVLPSSAEYAVLILSGPNNELKRDAIRATWISLASNIFIENGEKLYKWNHTWTSHRAHQDIIKFYFVIGTRSLDNLKLEKLKSENDRTHDLLLLDYFEDSYQNLARKMLSSLVWLSKNMTKLKYLIKCDDDSFVRIDLIVRDLEAFAPEMSSPTLSQYISYKKSLPSYRGLYWGYFDGRAHVYLNGKWQEQEWFLCDNYLPYALGGGYVISKSIVDYIALNSDLLSHYKSEDVSMGVWTSALDGINRVHDIRFDTQWKSRGCTGEMLVRHKQTPTDMFQMYRTLVYSQGNKLCKTEITERKSYVYKWNVLPSSCCKSEINISGNFGNA